MQCERVENERNIYLQVNFGDLYIPVGLDYPQPHVIGSLVGQHGVSSGPVVVVDAQTILVPDFTYDGQAPGKDFGLCHEVDLLNAINSRHLIRFCFPQRSSLLGWNWHPRTSRCSSPRRDWW
jgi:hypothetical protein